MNIVDFDTLLMAARQQPEPQRLLFVFLEKSLPGDHAADEAQRYESGEGGALEPVMAVDKGADELTTYDALVTESEAMGKPWSIALVACLGGRKGEMPPADDVEKALKMMMHKVETGGDLSKFMAFDRQGTPLQFG